MKKKLILSGIAITITCTVLYGQLKVVNSGNVGIGTNNPVGKLDVLGNFNVLNGNAGIGTSNPVSKLEVLGSIYTTHSNGARLRIQPSNPFGEIGSNTNLIEFWYTGVGFNYIKAKYLIATSDSSLKTNVTAIDSSLSIIKQLNGVKYQFREIVDSVVTDSPDSTGFHYGFIAQDVEQVLPDLVSESHGYKGIEYDGIIPFLVEAVKSQQQTIEVLNARVSTLEETVDACCSSQRVTGSTTPNKQIIELSSKNSIILNQNDPNPFAQSTTITWFLPDDAKNAKLYFYDNNGRILKTVLINETGNGELLVYCSDLESGIYTYSLVVNEKVIDSKKMICTK